MRIELKISARVTQVGAPAAPGVPDVANLLVSDARLENYLSPTIADRCVVGGEVTVTIRAGECTLVVTFWAPSAPDASLLEALKTDVIGQLQDGVGEGGFEFAVDGVAYLLEPCFEHEISVSLHEDESRVIVSPELAIAARDGDLNKVKELLSSNRAAIGTAHQGYYPLHYAILYSHTEIVAALLDAGADPNIEDPLGNSPLDICTLANKLDDGTSAHIANMLLECGADASHQSEGGMSAHDYARIRGKELMASLLTQT